MASAVVVVGSADGPARKKKELAWILTPRISFSQDLPAIAVDNDDDQGGEEEEEEEKQIPSRNSRRRSVETTAMEELRQARGGISCSEDFEFSSALDLDIALRRLPSADELFSDGKLRPLHIPTRPCTPSPPPPPPPPAKTAPRDTHMLVFDGNHGHRKDGPLKTVSGSSRFRPSSNNNNHNSNHHYPRHPNPVAGNEAPVRIRCTCKHPPSAPLNVAPVSATMPVAAPASPKYNCNPVSPKSPKPSSKLTQCIRQKLIHILDRSDDATCRHPLSPRSFWPFSRSNSTAGQKSDTPVRPPPRRTQSAGERKSQGGMHLASSTYANNPPTVPSARNISSGSSALNQDIRSKFNPQPESGSRSSSRKLLRTLSSKHASEILKEGHHEHRPSNRPIDPIRYALGSVQDPHGKKSWFN